MVRSLILFVALLAIPEASATPRKEPTPKSLFGNHTRLRTGELSYMSGSSRGQLDIRNMSVEVTNTGRIPAHQIQVSVTLPGGARVLLKGPKTLAPRDRTFYSSASKVPVAGMGHLQVRVTCSECSR